MPQAGSPRIVISGIGVVSPFGAGRERFWDHITRGCSGTRRITEFDASEFDCQVAAPVSGVTIDDVPAMYRLADPDLFQSIATQKLPPSPGAPSGVM